MSEAVDILIIGGGVNGCGIARDAAGRGYSVLLCEMGDLASATSSASTKLIHGGLRYLEFYDFRLVREALREREVLWRMAPHIISPLRLVLPYREGLRPAWMLRLGLFLYDHIGGRTALAPTKVLELSRDETGKPLKAGMFGRGFEYSDCRVDDARLVVLNARDAADRGAGIRTRTRVLRARREGDRWNVDLQDQRTGHRDAVRARALVNAAGPWVARVLTGPLGLTPHASTRLVQGSHIVVPKLFDHDRAYILQNGDGRVVFVSPYEGDFTLIGTTDRDYAGDPAKVAPTPEDIDYLCRVVSENFARCVCPKDVVWAFSGVRLLVDDGVGEARAASRDYVIGLDAEAGSPAVLSLFGGKITTYRRLAEAALDRLTFHLPAKAGVGRRWTADAPLPGGDFAVGDVGARTRHLQAVYPFLDGSHALRLVQAYGTRAGLVLGNAKCRQDLGREFGASLTEAEVRYLAEHEWAETAEDIVWRRSKLGLRLSTGEVAALDAFMLDRLGQNSPSRRATSAPWAS